MIIEGCVEDVIEIILNFKGFVFFLEEDELVVMYLWKFGVGEVIVVDINLFVGVIIYNLELYIVIFNDDGCFEMEFIVECGCGYVFSVFNDDLNVEIGCIVVDLIYFLVFKVIYKVEVI